MGMAASQEIGGTSAGTKKGREETDESVWDGSARGHIVISHRARHKYRITVRYAL